MEDLKIRNVNCAICNQRVVMQMYIMAILMIEDLRIVENAKMHVKRSKHDGNTLRCKGRVLQFDTGMPAMRRMGNYYIDACYPEFPGVPYQEFASFMACRLQSYRRKN